LTANGSISNHHCAHPRPILLKEPPENTPLFIDFKT
jgi:hypothetical protein